MLLPTWTHTSPPSASSSSPCWITGGTSTPCLCARSRPNVMPPPQRLLASSGSWVMNDFPSVSIEDLAADRRGAIKIGPFGSQLKKEEMVRDGIRVYGQENVISDDFTLGERRISRSKFLSLNTCELYPGDVVMTMMGTVGRCSVVPVEAERGIMDSHLLRIQPASNAVTSRYLAIALSAPSIINPQISQLA